MYSTIVVGCDGSPGSLAAIELAQRLRAPAGRLVLTSVRPLDIGADTAEEILQLSAKRVPSDVPVDTVAEPHDSVAGGLNDTAERERADLIVIGPTHHHSLARLAGRMTVQRLLYGAPCAVAVAPAHPANGGRILVAYDASPEARDALRAAYDIAARTNTGVELCRSIEPVAYMGSYAAVIDPEWDRAARARAEQELEAAAAEAPDGVDVTTRVGIGNAADSVLAGESGAAMIVAGSRGYGTLHRAIAGSVSGALLTRADVPVLVTPR